MAKRIVQAKDIVRDIRSGMTDPELMKKYGLSARGLESAFTKLVNNRMLTVHEIYGHPSRSGGDDTIIVDDLRRLPRHFLSVSVSIYNPSDPGRKGHLRDVTEKGIGLTGIEARIGEVKSFIIPCRDFLNVDNIWFEAECMWIQPCEAPDEWRGGFQIRKISPKDLTHLRDLIRVLALD